jgi:hypothetical protein
MEFSAQRYYDHSKFANSYYLLMMAIETLLGQELFKSDGTRIFYASPEWMFRQRLNLLNKNGNPDYSSLDLPFAAYYRKSNWVIDTRPGVTNATAALLGMDAGSQSGGYVNVKFLQVETSFDFVAIYSRDDDAQLAYEVLTWLDKPAANFFTVPGLVYKGRKVDIPLQVNVEGLRKAKNFPSQVSV